MEMSNLVRLLIFCSYLCQLLYCCLFFWSIFPEKIILMDERCHLFLGKVPVIAERIDSDWFV